MNEHRKGGIEANAVCPSKVFDDDKSDCVNKWWDIVPSHQQNQCTSEGIFHRVIVLRYLIDSNASELH